MKSKISAFYLEKKSFVLKKICPMLLIETLKSKISDIVTPVSACDYTLLSKTPLLILLACTIITVHMPIFTPSTPNLIFCLINRAYFIRSVLSRYRRTFFTPGCFHNFERSKDVSIYIYVVYELCITNMYCGKFKKTRFSLFFL